VPTLDLYIQDGVMADAVSPPQVVKRLAREDSHNAVALGRVADQELTGG